MRNQPYSGAPRFVVVLVLTLLALLGCTNPQQPATVAVSNDPPPDPVEITPEWWLPLSRHIEGVRQWADPAVAWGDLGGWILQPEVHWSRTTWSIAIDDAGQPSRDREVEEEVKWVPGNSPVPYLGEGGAMRGCASCHQDSANAGRYPLYRLGQTPQTAAVLSILEMHDDRHLTQLTLGLRYPKGKPVQLKDPVRCASCHKALTPLIHRSHRLGEGMGGCMACHEGGGASAAAQGQGCSFCHESPTQGGDLPTTQAKSCAQCHPAPFSGMHQTGHGGLQCLDCHGGVHGGHGQPNPQLSGNKEGQGGPQCGGCHQVDAVDRPVPRENLYEDRWLSLVRAHWGDQQETTPAQ